MYVSVVCTVTMAVHGLMSFHMLAPSKRYKNAVLRDEADQPQGIKYSCY